MLDIDTFYVKTGNEFGRQQKLWFFALVFMKLYAPFQMLQVVFLGTRPNFNCTIGNMTYRDSCGPNYSKCDVVEYELAPDTFLKEWSDSPCSSTVSQMIQAASMLGIMTGALTLGPVSDRFGRKMVMGLTLISMLLLGVIGSFCQNLLMYTIIRFLVGVCCSGNILSSFVLSSELVGARYRGLCGNLFQSAFATGIMAYAGLAFLIQNDWRMLSLVASLIGFLLFLVLLYVPESPRWLYAQGRRPEAWDILQKLTPTNSPEGSSLHPSQLSVQLSIGEVGRRSRVSMWQMFRKKFWLVFVQIVSWFTNSILYYALTLSSHHLGKNLYVSTCLSGLVEIPAYALTAYLLQKIGRRVPLVVYMILAGGACIALEFTDKNLYVGLFGKMCISASFCIIYIHTSELFPTVVRNSGIGLCSAFARIGGVVASVFVGAEKGNIWPMIGLGILSVLAGILNLILPETLNRKLPETIEDLDKKQEDIVASERSPLLRGRQSIHSESESHYTGQ